MKNALNRFLTALVLAATLQPAHASDYLRLEVDLDGNKKTEVITASVSPATPASGDNPYSRYTVKVGSASYKDQFFAAEGDKPQIDTIRINFDSGARQILVTTFPPKGCDYTILAYVNGTLVRLLHHETDICDPPRLLGYGKIATYSWMGFWKMEETYTLNGKGDVLSRDPQTLYDVHVLGVAANLATMKRAGCSRSSIPAGAYVMVDKYDEKNKRYLVRNKSAACGWVPKDSIGEDVAELPLAD